MSDLLYFNIVRGGGELDLKAIFGGDESYEEDEDLIKLVDMIDDEKQGGSSIITSTKDSTSVSDIEDSANSDSDNEKSDSSASDSSESDRSESDRSDSDSEESDNESKNPITENPITENPTTENPTIDDSIVVDLITIEGGSILDNVELAPVATESSLSEPIVTEPTTTELTKEENDDDENSILTSVDQINDKTANRKVRFRRESDVICNDYVSGILAELSQLGLDTQ